MASKIKKIILHFDEKTLVNLCTRLAQLATYPPNQIWSKCLSSKWVCRDFHDIHRRLGILNLLWQQTFEHISIQMCSVSRGLRFYNWEFRIHFYSLRLENPQKSSQIGKIPRFAALYRMWQPVLHCRSKMGLIVHDWSGEQGKRGARTSILYGWDFEASFDVD